VKQLLSSLAVRVTLVFAVMFLAFAGGFLVWYDQFRRDALLAAQPGQDDPDLLLG